MINRDVKLEDIWKAELEIMDEIDRVCTENGLRYSLAYGTLLGAVRHGGFIPWDDDIDIMMPREDYEQLRAIWSEKAKDGFILEDETMHDDYMNNFAKVRKDHTTFLQFESERTCSYHTGFFVDIFPGDRVAPAGFLRIIQYAAFALNLLYNRGYPSGARGIRGICERIMLRLVPKRYHARVSDLFGRISRRWNRNPKAKVVFPNTAVGCNKFYPADLFEHLRTMEFHDRQYCVIDEYDLALRLEYGDYMQLPPEEERVWRHHPIIVDFSRNYEELSATERKG